MGSEKGAALRREKTEKIPRPGEELTLTCAQCCRNKENEKF